jgi:hypothetical protein
MRSLTKWEVLAVLYARQEQGLPVDSRLLRQVEQEVDGEAFFEIELADPKSFLSLRWQAILASRLLTPPGQPRTIQAVIERMKVNGWDFDRLASQPSLFAGEHNPRWFEPCQGIASTFDYNKFGWIAIVPVSDSERQESPSSTFYIYDGCHKALVFGWLLLKGCGLSPLKWT